MSDLATFRAAFHLARTALGLAHYDVSIGESDLHHYAEIDIEPDDCVAQVLVNVEKCAAANNTESTAVHECLHLLLADLQEAWGTNPKAALVEEERVVRRLEPLVYRALFPNGFVVVEKF